MTPPLLSTSSESVQELILDTLKRQGSVSSTRLLFADANIDTNIVFGALKSLESHEKVVYTPMGYEQWVLTDEGNEICKTGSHEHRVLKEVIESMPAGTSSSDLQACIFVNVIEKIWHGGLSICFKNKWVRLSNGHILAAIDKLNEDTTAALLSKLPCALQDLSLDDQESLKNLRKRKLVDVVTVISYSVEKGRKFDVEIEKPFLELTSQMISTGSWKDKPFKPYNFDADGPKRHCGHLHPLLKMKSEFKEIFCEMGFTEMPTDNYVESSFWNFDALFVPQQHPARDSQDTFFTASPAESTSLPTDYVEKIRNVHSKGGYGSIGYQAPWSVEETKRNVLRTHTTATSARMLYALAKEPQFRPVKLFSIDKVFRNESVDATHLAEFHQIEGLIADVGLTLSDLMGVLYTFFSKLGMKKLKFKPTYNPYTEPSLEIYSFHEGLGKWIEVGNSGIFRPEMLKPMGFDDSVSVIAWGLSLERPAMIKYQLNNIRDLVGHKVDLNMIYTNPICMLGK